MPATPDATYAQRADDASCDDVRDVVRLHGPFIGRSLRYLGVPEADLEDAAQEVFVVVHRKLGSFEGRSSLTTWLYGVCTRVASARRRSAAHRKESLTPEVPEMSVAATQEADVEHREARQRLLDVLDRLDEDKRAVFVLYEIEQQSMKDVAQEVGCPLQTAYYRLHAARSEVLQAIEELRNREEGR